MRSDPGVLAKVGSLNLSEVLNPYVMSIRHTEHANGGKEVELVIENVNLELIDNPNVQEGQRIEWMFGYPEQMSDKFSGTVTSVVPTFDADSGLTLTLICNDAVAEMLHKKRQKVWKQVTEGKAQITESDIVIRIARDLGLNPDVEPTKTKYSQLSQNDYDWDFIQKLAETATPKAAGKQTRYVAWVDEQNKILHFKPMDIAKKPSRKYSYFLETENPTLLKFEPRTKTNTPDDTGNTETVSKAVNPNKPAPKTPTEAPIVSNVASNTTNTNRKGIGKYTINPIDGKFTYTKDASGETPKKENLAGAQLGDPSTQDQLHNLDNTVATSENEHQASEMDQIEAEVEVLGDPTLRANDMIEILNVGRRFSGSYYTHNVTHEISGSGYTTKAELRRNAIPTSDGTTADEFKGQQVNETPAATANTSGQTAPGVPKDNNGTGGNNSSGSSSQGSFDPVTGKFIPPKKGK